ncbi:MAG: DUF924 domain-containing protein [Gammaproteobacteria bacterium]|nr:DUF924 domain-containing protein [Gammaproteobacteria bacterium]
MEDYSEILTFWFGHGETNLEVMNEKSSLWWNKDPALDKEIKTRFESHLVNFSNGELDAWQADSNGWLAIIILADQFSRNIYRDSPKAFALDAKAINLVHDGIRKAIDKKLRLIEQVFFNMPLMHSESMADQELSILQFKKIVESAQDEEKERLQVNVNYAVSHRDIIQRFGRYPHRNTALGRESTPEEIEFLQQPGSSF